MAAPNGAQNGLCLYSQSRGAGRDDDGDTTTSVDRKPRGKNFREGMGKSLHHNYRKSIVDYDLQPSFSIIIEGLGTVLNVRIWASKRIS